MEGTKGDNCVLPRGPHKTTDRLFLRLQIGHFGFWFTIFVTIAIVPLLNSTASSQATSIVGTVTNVRDGDTLEVGPIAIRLMGVSAPELGEPLGRRAKDFMLGLVFAKPIRCDLNGEKSYDRFVAICFFRGKDIGASLISAGLALDCPRFSNGLYESFEQGTARKVISRPKYCLKLD